MSSRSDPWQRHIATRLLVAAVLACALGSCAVGPNFHRPAPPAGTHYTSARDPSTTVSAQGVAQHFTPGAQVANDWWRLFNSKALQAIVSEALASNPGLQAAQASLRGSEYNLRAGYGIFYPQIRADAQGARERFAPVEFGESARAQVFNLFTLSASASYALDLFGGERRQLEALAAQVDVQRATEHATYITLLANIVNTVVAKAAYRAEIDATQQLIDLQREQVKLAQVQYRAGTQPYSNVLSLESQLASYEATIPQLQQKLAQSADLLATLVGHVPADWTPPQIELEDLHLPRELPVSVPSDLVRQRPDVLIAEATAHTASADVGVATAAMLPSITLNGSYAAYGTTTSRLFAAGGRAWSIGGEAAEPLFQGGTLWFNRKAAVENYHAAMGLYRQTVLGAFQQVADVLGALDHDASALAAEDHALRTAREALHLVETQYEAGLDTYLDVLNADAQYHQAVINDLQAVAMRYQDTVALYVALGGGWWSERTQAGESR
ncbi:MAG TPA: efflux transporter outer membrane subunit [Steroidobacteraceae bacterium]|nr:efflux transporter outer membrane subunit [Steroidobacteraceae bacterium]